MSGYLTFRLADRELACHTEEVREVVRLAALKTLPGLPAGVSGLLELRGTLLPVADMRHDPASRGDVLVLADGEPVGVVVDQVTAVHGEGALVPDGAQRPPTGMPSYVRALLRRRTGGDPVLLVDLRQLRAVAAP